MMYYWVVKHDGSEDQDIISYREDLGTLRQHHIIVESLSPLVNGASFALGRRICAEKTWRDLNDALVAHLQSRRTQDSNEEPALGIYLGANNPVQYGGRHDSRDFSRDSRGVQEFDVTEREAIVL
jgi:hypothetical protein